MKSRTIIVAASVLAAVLLVCSLSIYWLLTTRIEGHYFQSSDGVRIHYTDEGAGEPVILLHGFAVNSDLNWRLPGLIDALTPHFRVISMDLRGHGLSDKPHDPTLYGEKMAGDVVALLDHLNIERAHLVGYSLGGIISLQLAATHPDRFISVAPLGAGWEDPDDSVFLAALAGLADDLETGRGAPPLSAKLGGEREKPGVLHTAWVRFVTRYLADGPAMAAMLRAIQELTIERDDLRRIPLPVCSIVGSRDAMKAGVDAMIGLVPEHTVVVVEGADHITAIRSPELRDTLIEFLNTQSGRAVAAETL